MKNIILVLALIVSSAAMSAEKSMKKEAPTPAHSNPVFERNYGIAGCGLGSVAIGKHGGQIFAATTNGTSSNQMFGISAGTLNCLDSATAEVASRMDQFIIVNRAQLQADVARGNGETISAISSYMGCSESSKEIGQSLKTNYSTIFSKDSKANDVTDTIINVIISNPELSSKCNKLG